MAPFLKRLILTAVALPLVYTLAAVLTGLSHLAMAVAVSLVMAAGAAETGALLARSGFPRSRILIPLAAGTLPAMAYLETAGLVPAVFAQLWLVLLLGAVLAHSVVAAHRRPLAEGLTRVAGYTMQLMYPALFGAFIVRLAGLPDPSPTYLLFFALVFSNDISAYLAGKAVRGRGALDLKVSPGKTAAGFITGFAVSVAAAVAMGSLFPSAFPWSPGMMVLVGAAVAISTFVGDLAESSLKRAAGVKDSGLVMLGRGGVLDSVDSLVMSAPVLYLLLTVIRGV